MCGPPNPENYRKRLESGIKDESEEALILTGPTAFQS